MKKPKFKFKSMSTDLSSYNQVMLCFLGHGHHNQILRCVRKIKIKNNNHFPLLILIRHWNLLIRRLAGTTWGASTQALRISTEALVFSSAEYCAPVWCRSSHIHKLDTALNTALQTVSGCLRDTTANAPQVPAPLCHTRPRTAPDNTSRHLQGCLGQGEMEGAVEVSRTISATTLHQRSHSRYWPAPTPKAVDP